MYNPVLIGIATGGAFLAGFLLFFHPLKTNKVANRWLGFFVITLADAMLEIFLTNLNLQSSHSVALEFIGLFRFLSAPALYLSILYFVSPSKTFRSANIWHFIPFLFFFLFRIPFFVSGQNFQFSPSVATLVLPVLVCFLPVQTVVYGLFSLKKLIGHQGNIKKIVSSVEAIDMAWLRNFLWILAGIVFLWLNLVFFNIQYLFNFTPFLYLISIYFLAYFSLRQREIYAYDSKELQDLEEVIASENTLRPEKQGRLSDSQVGYLKTRLEQLMDTDKPYLENDLNLPDLARKLNMSSHEMSYLINKAFGENFFAFVNKYRVEEAKKLLLSQKYERLNMIGIAFEAGFNSKTAFNTTFKKITGQSPTEFVKSTANKPEDVPKDTSEPYNR